LVIKPLAEDSTPGTVKPVPVSLVEPVAYQVQLAVAVGRLLSSVSHPPPSASRDLVERPPLRFRTWLCCESMARETCPAMLMITSSPVQAYAPELNKRCRPI
jgi:hypothetical protein